MASCRRNRTHHIFITVCYTPRSWGGVVHGGKLGACIFTPDTESPRGVWPNEPIQHGEY